MLSVVITLLVALTAACAGSLIVRAIEFDFDPAEFVGLSGLFGLGSAGLVTLMLGVIPGVHGLQLPVFLVILAIPGFFGARTYFSKLRFSVSRGPWWLFVLAPLLLVSLIGVLAPSDMMDWDSLAYHLAVPKIWLNNGQIGYVQAIHHSNFPFTADLLNVWGLAWGGQTGAKAFSLCWYLFGTITLFGLSRRWFGERTAWVGALVFAGCPVALWESGTAYIDGVHGLFCGLAILYAAEGIKRSKSGVWVLSGLSLGFALGTKHTGLQTFAAILVIGILALTLQHWKSERSQKGLAGFKGLTTALVLGLVLASPWYIKSMAMTGNPVYPFFYKQFGGREWNQWRSDIYTREQKTFGVGTNPTQLGHAVLGLAYQPGRYVNPGQTEGRGFPTGSIGFVALLGGFLLATTGKVRGKEAIVLGAVGLSLLLWFLLSQQSRYLTSVVVPLGVLTAGLGDRWKWGRALGSLVVVQALLSLLIVWTMVTQRQIPVVTGQVSADEFQRQNIGFYRPAQAINALPGNVKVALYDEVFGFYLDKAYMWGNPGHSSMIPYETSESGDQLVNEMQRLGFTHAYVNLNKNFIDAKVVERFLLAISGQPYSAEERTEFRSNPDMWWRVLFADAVASGRLRPVASFPEGSTRPQSLLLELER